ncbi:hypothetical protein NDU88_005188 [Pleurodeles waltl]|uniref:Uncharacterized protein n=1 Tax=Pleurodeles waltl TaxID=8319 RepID=A0AAV7TA37_PLEWA|nr:hypothetical protein NDU88_005188 [Pleurodeles waltl]
MPRPPSIPIRRFTNLPRYSELPCLFTCLTASVLDFLVHYFSVLVRRRVTPMLKRGSKVAHAGVGAGAAARQDRTRGSGGAGEFQSSWTSDEAIESREESSRAWKASWSEAGSETTTPGEDEDEKSEWGKGSGQPESFKAAMVRKKMKKRISGSDSPVRQITDKASKALQWDYSSAPGLGEPGSLGGSLADTAQTVSSGEETKAESHGTQLACRKMQGAIRRVAKACTDFAIHIGEAETRVSKSEVDTAMQGEIRESLRSQMEDTQWKMADLENRARQSNL